MGKRKKRQLIESALFLLVAGVGFEPTTFRVGIFVIKTIGYTLFFG
jgi:hypothetical protein